MPEVITQELKSDRLDLTDLLEVSDLLLQGQQFRFRVAGWSMAPALCKGDWITVEPASLTELQVGDLLLFHHQGRLFCHRLVALQETGAGPWFITKGDAATECDAPLQPDQVLGRVVGVRPSWHWAGSLSKWIDCWRARLIECVANGLARLQGIVSYRRIMRAMLSSCFTYYVGIPEGRRWFRYHRIGDGTPQILDGHQHFHLVAKLAGICLGSLHVEAGAEGFWLQALYIRIPYRGLGVATHLLKLASKVTALNHAGMLLVAIERKNDIAVRLFEKAGFRSRPASERSVPLVLVRESSSEGMSTASPDKLFETYSRIASTNRATFNTLRSVLTIFQKQGIECILLKGADLIPRLYGVMGLRPMVDVDMLVREQDLPALDRLLTQLGYRPQIDGNPAYVDPDDTLALDIITNVWYVDAQEAIWHRAVQRDFAGIPVKGLGGNDLLIYLTAYNVIHRGYLSASFARDIAFLVEKGDLDWDFVVDEASRCHLIIPMYHGLVFVLTRYPGAPIPDHVLRRLAPSTVIERLWCLLFEKLVTAKPVAELGHLLLFLTQPGLKKWRWLSDAFFPSRAFLTYRYGDRASTHPILVRIARPFSLAWQGLLLSGRILAALLKLR